MVAELLPKALPTFFRLSMGTACPQPTRKFYGSITTWASSTVRAGIMRLWQPDRLHPHPSRSHHLRPQSQFQLQHWSRPFRQLLKLPTRSKTLRLSVGNFKSSVTSRPSWTSSLSLILPASLKTSARSSMLPPTSVGVPTPGLRAKVLRPSPLITHSLRNSVPPSPTPTLKTLPSRSFES